MHKKYSHKTKSLENMQKKGVVFPLNGRRTLSTVCLVLSSLLFGMTGACTAGGAVAAFVAFVPLFVLLDLCSQKSSLLWGFFYGVLAYSFYGSWMFSFSKEAFFFTIAVCGVEWAVIFLLLVLSQKGAAALCNKVAFANKDTAPSLAASVARFAAEVSACFQVAILVAYEIFKTQGFLGISYGNLGYSQFCNTFFIQIADKGGVFAVSGVVYFANFAIYMVSKGVLQKKLPFFQKELGGDGRASLKDAMPFLGVAMALLAFCAVYSFLRIRQVDAREKDYPVATICAVQNNSDPWKDGLDHYSAEIARLVELSKEAMRDNSDIDIVVWPETAVVPSIIQNYYSGKDIGRHTLVKNLMEYIDNQRASFVIGNFHVDKNGDYYNSAFLFKPRINTVPPNPEIYSKVHLVPFTETFPYKKQFPKIYAMLLAGDTHLWEPGKERSPLHLGDFVFGTPICFEDTFGGDCREFVRNGAKAFVNISCDAWSKSSRAQRQHLAMAVFRSVENHIPSVRSTASGVTCSISSTGVIKEMLEEFSSGYIVCKVPYRL